jgi:uncharacterized phiE125 gp8 family phage protein
MTMPPHILVPPIAEPVDLAEARAWLRLGTDGDDAVLAPAIAAARTQVEARTGLALMARTLREAFAATRTAGPGPILLATALQPVTAIVAVTVTGPAGDVSPAPAGLVSLAEGQLRLTGPVQGELTVTYVAGAATSPAAVPLADRVAVLEELAALMARREAGERGTSPQPEPRL